MSEQVLPRYGEHALSDLTPSLLAALGHRAANPLDLPATGKAVVLLIDGLGHTLLRDHREYAPFLTALEERGPLTVGFPSSTVISLASLGTGNPPGGHGILGTTFDLDGTEFDALKWTAAGRDQREHHPPERFQPVPTSFELAQAEGTEVTVVTRREFRDSGLTRAALRGGTFAGVIALGDLAAEVVTALRGPGRRLVYGYHSDLDTMGHVHGPGSLPWCLQLTQVDRLVETIAAGLPPGAFLVVTGDHGMVTMDRVFDAEADPRLGAGVRLLSGEPRARYVHAVPGAAGDVLAAWRDVLGDAAWVVSGEQAIDDGWFGPVSPHLAGRIGDVVAAARGGTGVIRPAAERMISRMVGQHGSLTQEEQLVPLRLARG